MRNLRLSTETFPAETCNIDDLYAQRCALERGRFAPNTEKSYTQDWKMFSRFCDRASRSNLPATTDTIALYLTDLLCHGRKVSTAVRRTSGISHMHRMNGYPSPVTEKIWRMLSGAKRLRQEQPRQMKPLTLDQVRTISGMLAAEETIEAIRDRAIFVLGFTSALRRSNITELLLEDVAFVPQGVVLKIRREKCDQEGKGRTIGVASGQHADTSLPQCLRDWLAVRGVSPGPLFTTVRERQIRKLSPAAVGRIVKRGVERLGLDQTKYAGHSLRSGFVVTAGEAGVSHLIIAEHVGHKRLDTLRRYFRPSDVFKSNASAQIGL